MYLCKNTAWLLTTVVVKLEDAGIIAGHGSHFLEGVQSERTLTDVKINLDFLLWRVS